MRRTILRLSLLAAMTVSTLSGTLPSSASAGTYTFCDTYRSSDYLCWDFTARNVGLIQAQSWNHIEDTVCVKLWNNNYGWLSSPQTNAPEGASCGPSYASASYPGYLGQAAATLRVGSGGTRHFYAVVDYQ